jgi:hypothetical protein
MSLITTTHFHVLKKHHAIITNGSYHIGSKDKASHVLIARQLMKSPKNLQPNVATISAPT